MNNKFNSMAEMPRTLQCKYDIISNFIEHWTSDDTERKQMYSCLVDYINDDHVNEIQGYFADTITNYEVGIDEGNVGTRTIASFTTEKEALSFLYDYSLKHPKAKIFIDTCTSDFLKG